MEKLNKFKNIISVATMALIIIILICIFSVPFLSKIKEGINNLPELGKIKSLNSNNAKQLNHTSSIYRQILELVNEIKSIQNLDEQNGRDLKKIQLAFNKLSKQLKEGLENQNTCNSVDNQFLNQYMIANNQRGELNAMLIWSNMGAQFQKIINNLRESINSKDILINKLNQQISEIKEQGNERANKTSKNLNNPPSWPKDDKNAREKAIQQQKNEENKDDQSNLESFSNQNLTDLENTISTNTQLIHTITPKLSTLLNDMNQIKILGDRVRGQQSKIRQLHNEMKNSNDNVVSGSSDFKKKNGGRYPANAVNAQHLTGRPIVRNY
jgi:hypothetical protein